MNDDLQATTQTADSATDTTVTEPLSALATDTDATNAIATVEVAAKEFLCLRCSHAWDRHLSAPRDSFYRPRACPSCHSAYWQATPKLQHARRPSATPALDRVARQAITRESRQRGRLSRVLYAMDPAIALAAVRAHPPIAAILAGEPAPPLAAAEPQRVIIELRQQAAPEPRYPWQGHGSRIDLDSAAPTLIPPPPSVATLPSFVHATLSDLAPEEVVARREP